jgi:hypothetical protein
MFKNCRNVSYGSLKTQQSFAKSKIPESVPLIINFKGQKNYFGFFTRWAVIEPNENVLKLFKLIF